MTKELATIEPKTDIADAAALMAERRIRHLPVVEHGELAGIISIRDLLSWAASEGLEWDADGDNWTARLEIYKSDPREVPNMADWDTELQFKLKD